MKVSALMAAELGNQVRMYLAGYQFDNGLRSYHKLKNNTELVQVIIPKFYSSIVRKECDRCVKSVNIFNDIYKVLLPIKHFELETKNGYAFGFCGGRIFSPNASVCSGEGTKHDWYHFIKKEKNAANLLIHLPAFINHNGY